MGTRNQICFCVLLVTLLLGAEALPKMFLGRGKDGFVPRKLRQRYSEEDIAHIREARLAQELTLTQKLDHFNDSETRTWTQRYFVNTQYYRGMVNFLNIGGEAAADIEDVLEGIAPVLYAEQFGAACYSIEHRFYGESKPTDTNTVDDLRFLSSRQALADAAAFIDYINQQSNAPDTQKWVVFGGSYAGNLALWFRELYPEHAIGAVGSSGPVLAQVDFYGYLEVVENDLKEFDATNNKNCVERVGAAMDSIEQLMETKEGRAKLNDKFNVYPTLEESILNENNVAYFYSNILGSFMETAQYYGVNMMSDICSVIVDTRSYPDPIDGLLYGLFDGFTYFGISYSQDVEELSNTDWTLDPDSRSWIWQTCTEFGYYQTTDRGSNVFRSTNPLNVNINMCKDVFGITIDQIKASIDSTNQYYGAKNFYTGTNAVITHGSYDPWHWLGILQSLDNTTIQYTIKDGTHCSDMFEGADDQAQQIIRTNLGQWINGPPNPISKRNITDNSGKPPGSYYSHEPSHIVINEKPIVPSQPRDFTKERRARNQYTGRFNHGLRAPPLQAKEVSLAAVQGYISQPVDHFNALDRRTFQQKFYSNSQWAKPGGPNFLMIGGEGPESDVWVTNAGLAWLKFAQEVGATVYDLEHRYYGDSKTGTNDLTYLTSAQMLFDVANFINQTNKNTGSTAKWITFGGSYSGALSAWAREWFPDLIAGAVGSSGPVEAKVDFYEYLLVVERALTEFSPQCAQRTKDAFDQLRNLSTSAAGRQRISQLFRLDPPWTADTVVSEIDFQQVFTYLYGDFQGVVQYSDDNNSAGGNNVSTLCGYITADKDPLAALGDVHNWAFGSFYEISSSADADNQYLKSLISQIETGDPDELAGILWTWQTCNEFGYYQSTDYGTSLFGSVTPVNYFVEMCESVFNITMDTLAANVDKSIFQYGGRHKFRGSNVVLPNGSHDPWSALGLYNHPDPSVVSILINGTAHCADMYPARDKDLPGLVAARTLILDNIKQWLA